MNIILGIYIYIFAVFCLSTAEFQEPQVKITQGILKGRIRTNRDGRTFYSFQSIPYGQPPTGELRFKAPVPAAGWNGTRDATVDVPECSQYHSVKQTFVGQEDCLYLNVYTPNVSEAYPVMVYIHGGAYTFGSSSETLYGPEFILTKNVVLVTINYRLGIFGYLNLDDPNLGVSANAGMKDQVLALHWIQDNIKQFGGNSSNVLIFGESAGGVSVHLHVLSPMSAGLFHKAIAQSGVALIALLDGTKNNGEIVAKQLGIQTENKTSMITSLREVSDRDLVAATAVVSPRYDYFTVPIVENPSKESAFLPATPIDIIRSGKYNHVPFITGVNDAEGIVVLFLRNRTAQDRVFTNLTYFVPKDLNILQGSAKEEQISQQLKEFYFNNTDPNALISQMLNLVADYLFVFPAYRSILEHLKTSVAPVYFYFFTAVTRLNLLRQLDKTLVTYPGAAHGDELGYLFHNIFTPSDIEQGSFEDLAIKNMVSLWTNFAIYGNPTPDHFSDFKWSPVEKNSFKFLHITTNSTYTDEDLLPENMKLWSDIYEKNSE